MYKKVYVEITNICNLNCDFCIKNKRESKFISIEDFKKILIKLNNHTKYLYFHVLGEPLMHPYINELIDLAHYNNYFVNITTNGYLIDKIKDNKNIRQINISLHSYNEKYGKTIDEYLNNIFSVTEILKEYTYISFRLWAKTKYKEKIIEFLKEKYNVEIIDKMKLDNNVFIEFEHEFVWPSLDNGLLSDVGTCYALKDHIAILVDGTIVPCCLDTLGIINLGNIYQDNIEKIIDSKRYQNMLIGFQNNKKCEELCRRCNFIK